MAINNPHAQGTVTLGNNPIISTLPYQSNVVSQYQTQPNPTAHFSVERVDNGFILRSGRFNGDISKTKVCTSIEEVKDLFVAVLVEYQLEK